MSGMTHEEENINEQRVIPAPLEIEEFETLTSTEVQGDVTGSGITVQQHQPNHVNPEASPMIEGENMTQEVNVAAIVLMIAICIIQTGPSGVATYLQGSVEIKQEVKTTVFSWGAT